MEFDELMERMVNDFAPRRFAIVQEYGDGIDGRVAAWGMAFDDGAEIVAVDGSTRFSVTDPERVVRRFSQPEDVTAHLVWVDPVQELPPAGD